MAHSPDESRLPRVPTGCRGMSLRRRRGWTTAWSPTQHCASAADVFAAGDVAAAFHPYGRHVRVEHWASALNPHDTVVCRGNLDDGEFIAFWTADGRVTAGMNVDVREVTDAIQELIRSRRPVPVERLTDPAVPLEDLIA